MRMAIPLALAAMLSTGAHASQMKSLLERWEKDRAEMEAGGVTESQYLLASIINEGQYFAGYCSQHLDDRTYKLLQPPALSAENDSPMAREVIAQGNDLLRQGIRDAATKPPSEELCARTLEGYFKDQRDVVRYVGALKK